MDNRASVTSLCGIHDAMLPLRAWRANPLEYVMKDHHNPNRIHSVDDDRPDSDGWNWDWYSDLADGKHKTWGFTTARKFENINFVAKNDHPGFWRRLGNWFIDG